MDVNLRTRVIVLHQGRLLLHAPEGDGAGGWTLPGGGLEAGETLAECGARETYEETGVAVHIGGVAFLRERPWTFHNKGPSGEAGLGLEVYFYARPATESVEPRAEHPQDAAPRWVPLQEVTQLPVFPIELKVLVQALLAGETLQGVPLLQLGAQDPHGQTEPMAFA